MIGAKKKSDSFESKNSVDEEPKGVDGFAASSRPSKHQTRKAKKQAKKEAKVIKKYKSGGVFIQLQFILELLVLLLVLLLLASGRSSQGDHGWPPPIVDLSCIPPPVQCTGNLDAGPCL